MNIEINVSKPLMIVWVVNGYKFPRPSNVG